jgi:molybdopterin-guanine dinucleotide biosynthesis protein A
LPYLTKSWLDFLLQRARECTADALIPMSERGAEPLCAMYRKGCESILSQALEQGVRKVKEGLTRVGAEYITPAEWKGFASDGLLFKNMNTLADYEEAKANLAGCAQK